MSDPRDPQPTRDDAAHVLFAYNEGGWPAGSFTTHLIKAMLHAVPQELNKLATVYPGLATAVRCARDTDDGIARLVEILRQAGHPPTERPRPPEAYISEDALRHLGQIDPAAGRQLREGDWTIEPGDQV